MKTVILVSLEWLRPQDGKFGLGISSIAAALEDAGVPWRIIEGQVNDRSFSISNIFDKLVSAIKEVGAGCLVGFGTYVWNDQEVCSLISKLQGKLKGTGTKIVLGGPQISYMGKGQLEITYPKADYFVRGHGEMAMVTLANEEKLTSNSGVHVAGTPDMGHKADHDLLSLPSPYLLGTTELRQNIRWETQRGCPYKCSFCQHREPGKWLKQGFDKHRLECELALFADKRVQRISVLDPIFNISPERAIDILNSIKDSGVDAHISVQSRFEMCTQEFLDELKGLNVTLEFGLQTNIEKEYRAIGRPNNMKIVHSTIRELHERQIDFEVSLIYGLPYQTLESFKKTVNWCKQQEIPRVRAWPLMLLRGTSLYDHKDRFGLIESTDQAIPIVVSSNSFSDIDHAEMTCIASELERG